MYTMCEQRPKVHKENSMGQPRKQSLPVILCSNACALELCHSLSLASCTSLSLCPLDTNPLLFNLFLTFLIEGYQETYRKSTQSRIFAKSDRNYLVMRATVDHFFLFLSLPLEKIEPKPNIFADGTFRTGLIRTPLPYDP